MQENRIIGTYQTASPQIIFKEKYTRKCDIYSLGVTLYWMFYEKFPFARALEKEEFLKFSLNFDQEAHIRPSAQVAHLIRSMLSFREEDRIEGQQLFSHPLFKKIPIPDPVHQVRESIGRNLGQNVSVLMEEVIPIDFALYVDGGETLQFSEQFMKVVQETKNFKFKIHFMKLLLREVCEVEHSEKIKLKVQFSIMKELLRLGLDIYIIYLYSSFRGELNSQHTLGIFDMKLLSELNGSKYFQQHIDLFDSELDTYKNSQEKSRLSEEQKMKLSSNCQEYGIGDKFRLILKGELLAFDQEQFLGEVKKSIVELIYFMKEEINYYASRETNLPKEDEERYRKLVILVHHFNMFILQHKIFPSHYNPQLNYDSNEFARHELYDNKHAFLQLAAKIKAIISKFEI